MPGPAQPQVVDLNALVEAFGKITALSHPSTDPEDATHQRLDPFDQARIHCLQALGMAGNVASQEAQKLAEQRVVSFRACNTGEQHLAAGENAVADLAALAELKGATHGFRHGGLVADGQGGFDVETGRHGALRLRGGCLHGNAIALTW
jgi:hypothetical protein